MLLKKKKRLLIILLKEKKRILKIQETVPTTRTIYIKQIYICIHIIF